MKGWLTGWKAIAKYIDRSVKTAKRYHKIYGMPVRRGPGGMPMAIMPELNKWLIIFSDNKKKMNLTPKCAENLPKITPK